MHLLPTSVLVIWFTDPKCCLQEGFDYGGGGFRDNARDGQSGEESDPAGDPGDCLASGLVSSYEKVVDFTYDVGRKTQIQTDLDIGIINQCLDQCKNTG